MSDDLSAVEKSVEEILIDLMDEKVMSAGAQALLTRGLQASYRFQVYLGHPKLRQRK
jgi:hypothetical protein